MENKDKNKAAQKQQDRDKQTEQNQNAPQNEELNSTKEGGEADKNINVAEEKARNRGLEKTYQSEHQPLPGEGTPEAKGIAHEDPEDCEKEGKD